MRLIDWRKRLSDYIASEARVPFAWGTSDCALFAAGAVDAQTGVDPAASWRGTYDTEFGAARVLAEAGFSTVADAAAAALPEIPPGEAGVGDVCVVAQPDAEALGVCLGDHVVLRGIDGLVFVARSEMARAFKCG